VRELISRASEFCTDQRHQRQLRADAIEPQWTEDILKARGLKAPIGE
jgi:hypothetical protein